MKNLIKNPIQKIDLFLFDLDGTLVDSKRDIAESVNYTMRTIGLAPLPHETIYEFVGNGVTPLIRKSVETAGGIEFDAALKIFMDHYDQHLLDTTDLFPGALEVLSHFSNTPKIVITNKSQGFAEKIITGLKLDHHFKGIFGGDTKFPKKPSPEIVHYLLEEFQVDADKTVIVGDSRVDLETGKNAGIFTCAATYGFRPRQELEDAGADVFIETAIDLLKFFS